MLPFRGRAGADGLDGSGVGEIRRFPASTHSPQRHAPFLACPMQKLPLDSPFFWRPVAVSVCGKPGKDVPVGGLGSGVGLVVVVRRRCPSGGRDQSVGRLLCGDYVPSKWRPSVRSQFKYPLPFWLKRFLLSGSQRALCDVLRHSHPLPFSVLRWRRS
jgi:hypothetical protein